MGRDGKIEDLARREEGGERNKVIIKRGYLKLREKNHISLKKKTSIIEKI